MLKKIITMLMGMVCGVGLLLGWQEYNKNSEPIKPVEPPKPQKELIKVDFDTAFEAARRGEHFLDEQEKQLKESTENGIKKMESEGDAASKTFKKFLEPKD